MSGVRLLLLTVMLQVIGYAAGGMTQELTRNLAFAVALHSLVAILGARILGLPRSWQILNLVLPVALLFASNIELPRTALFILVGILLLIYVPTFWTRVPYYPTSDPMYPVLLAKLPADTAFVFLDVGCGFGRLLAYLADRCPKGRFEGVEIGVLPYFVAKLRSLRRPNMVVRFQSFWSFSFAPYDIVYAFLAPGPMPHVWKKAKAEMRPGSTFFTNTFAVGAEPTSTHTVADAHGCTLYEHRLADR